jgi:hypothetical protein
MRTMDMPPYAPTLIESTRAIGYTLEAAVADIVDNSIAAQADSIEISFFPVGEAYISVLDNGKGMDVDEIDTAMQYGSRSPEEHRADTDLGRFGLGLKTASLSQCRVLTVISKKNASIEGRRWDIDHVKQTGQWSLLVLDDSDMKLVPQYAGLVQLTSGTLVVWQKLDRLGAGEANFEETLGRRMGAVRAHLSLVFHRYLSGEPGIQRLRLSINGSGVDPSDPFAVKKSLRAMDDETMVVRGQRITIRPYILPHLSKMTAPELAALGGEDGLRKQQGFYVYRNRRLLVWGTWFKMIRQGDLSKLARIQVDIPNSLDDLWTLDIKKSVVAPPAEVRQNLKVIIEKVAERSKRTWTFRGKKETDDSGIHVWDRFRSPRGGVYYAINRRHPLVVQCSAGNEGRCGKALESLLRQVERSIPLNQLYVDLSEDEQIENDSELPEGEVTALLRQLLDTCSSRDQRIEMLKGLATAEPFDSYPEVLEQARKEIADAKSQR